MSSQAPTDPRTTVGLNIRALRDSKGWSQRELAAKVNAVDTLAVSRWERGKAMPAPENLVALAEALGCTISAFYEPTEAAA